MVLYTTFLFALFALAAAQVPPQAGGFAQKCHDLGVGGNTGQFITATCGANNKKVKINISQCLVNNGGYLAWEEG
jgi:hypothetical protein